MKPVLFTSPPWSALPDLYVGFYPMAIGIAYFAIRGRHKLVLSPEEEFAMTRGEHGAHLQEEGYGHTSVTEITTDDPTP